jgi:hypothetical protein
MQAHEEEFYEQYKLPSRHGDTADWERVYRHAIEIIIAGREGFAPGDPLSFMLAWPRRRFVEIFATHTLDLPPVAASASHSDLAQALWESVRSDNEGHSLREQLFELMLALSDSFLYPLLREASTSGEAAHWLLVRAAVFKMKHLNAEVAELRASGRRRGETSMYSAHPAWFYRAAGNANVYRRYYTIIKAFQVPMAYAKVADADDTEMDDVTDSV